MIPETYKFQGPTYLKAHAKGLAEGEATGEAKALLAVLEARGLAPTDEQRQLILSCTDLEQLNKWVRKAVTVADVAELFAQ